MDRLRLQEEGLSRREFEVVELVARGYKNREIAEVLEIEERTARFHVANILKKPKVRNRAEARCYACRNGWMNN